MSVPVREVMFASPLFDFLRLSVRSTRGVAPAAIRRLEEALVLALELLFEYDSLDLSPARSQALSALNVCAIQPDVVRQFPRLGYAGIEDLTPVLTSVLSRFFKH
jgi:hypothetical protein